MLGNKALRFLPGEKNLIISKKVLVKADSSFPRGINGYYSICANDILFKCSDIYARI